MRKRTAAGAAGVAGVAALGVYLLDFGMPGLPSAGDGDTFAVLPTDADADAVDPQPAPAEPEPVGAGQTNDDGTGRGGAPGELAADETASAPLPAADVLIDGEGYLLATRWASDAEPIRERATLEQVVEATKRAVGDDRGFRVRIARTPEATAGAQDDLLDRLEAAAVPDDAIDFRNRLVEFDGT